MKLRKRVLCLLLLTCVLVSCDNRSAQKQYRKFFDGRTAEPMHMEQTVGTIRYTVTLNQSEYYLGDDIDLTVSAENVGTEPIAVTVNAIHPIQYALCVEFEADGEYLNAFALQRPVVAAGASDTLAWPVGEVLSNYGRFSTAAFCEKLAKVQEFKLVISVSGAEDKLEVPLVLHTDLAVDADFEPYLKQGTMTESLYLRARVMNQNETIYVLVPDLNHEVWQKSAEYRRISYISHYRVEEWTGAELLAFLKAQADEETPLPAPVEYLFAQWPFFWVAGYTLDENFDLQK